MIKAITTVITFLSVTGILQAACVSKMPIESSTHVRINAALAGTPLKGAKVVILREHTCNCISDLMKGNPMDISMVPLSASQITDENGIANLPELAPGEYDIVVTLNGVASSGFVGLHVTSNPKITTIPIDFTSQVQRVEEVPILFYVHAFQGTVKDLSGATIPGATFVVVKRGSQAKDVVLTSKADGEGHFLAQLAEGTYIAVFFSPGFRPAITPFQIARGGSSQLSVGLRVGGCP